MRPWREADIDIFAYMPAAGMYTYISTRPLSFLDLRLRAWVGRARARMAMLKPPLEPTIEDARPLYRIGLDDTEIREDLEIVNRFFKVGRCRSNSIGAHLEERAVSALV